MKYVIISITALIIIILGIICIKYYKEKNIKIDNIKYMHFSYTTGYAINDSVSYEIKCDESCLMTIKPNGIAEEDAKEVEASSDTIKEIENILNKYKVSRWNNFHKSDKYVLDGNSFSISIKLENNNISASGYMMYPKNYRIVKNELDNFFNKYISNEE